MRPILFMFIAIFSVASFAEDYSQLKLNRRYTMSFADFDVPKLYKVNLTLKGDRRAIDTPIKVKAKAKRYCGLRVVDAIWDAIYGEGAPEELKFSYTPTYITKVSNGENCLLGIESQESGYKKFSYRYEDKDIIVIGDENKDFLRLKPKSFWQL